MTSPWILIPLLAIVLPLLVAGGWMGATWLYGSRSSREPSDAAVVLGAAVWGDEPCPVFRERIRHGITLYNENVIRFLVMTGGRGDGNRRAESVVARDYALRNGVPESAILIEDESRTTWQNMVFAKRVMDRHGLRTALIVSDPIHMRRAMRMARDAGLIARPAPTPTTRYISPRKKLRFLWRELQAHVVYLTRGE